MIQATEQRLTRKIAVYRESPIWSKYARWFNVPIADLDSLWVADYEVTGDISTHSVETAARQIRDSHADCVLIY